MDATVTGRRPRRGFTLIEMLAVVVIIGILASLITAAALAVITKAKVARIAIEIGELDKALKEYKNLYGDYPPDSLTDTEAVKRHIRRAFPRCDVDAAMGKIPTNLAPANALVFWLGGIPEARGGGWVLTGFCADPRDPFASEGARKPPLFDFKPERLAMENDALAYYPDTGVSAGPEACPYHYFRAQNQSYSAPAAPSDGSNRGAAGPMLDTRVYTAVNKDSFQIICAGLDNHFGSGVKFPTGEDYTPEALDNITNFSEGTLEDEIP